MKRFAPPSLPTNLDEELLGTPLAAEFQGLFDAPEFGALTIEVTPCLPWLHSGPTPHLVVHCESVPEAPTQSTCLQCGLVSKLTPCTGGWLLEPYRVDRDGPSGVPATWAQVKGLDLTPEQRAALLQLPCGPHYLLEGG